MNFYRIFIVISMLLFLSNCSVFSPIKTDETSYELKTIPSVAIQKTRRTTLIIMQPEANSIYNTTRMVYTIKPYQVAYFAKNRWAASPGKMLQQLMIQTLQNTHYFKAVIAPPFSGMYDYILNTQLFELQQDFTHNPSVIRLRLNAQLIQSGTNRIIATKQFTVIEPAPQNTPYGGVIAANRAVSELLRQLVNFCVKH
jgi:cholesterol transport system auxiliary component